MQGILQDSTFRLQTLLSGLDLFFNLVFLFLVVLPNEFTCLDLVILIFSSANSTQYVQVVNDVFLIWRSLSESLLIFSCANRFAQLPEEVLLARHFFIS